MRPQTANEPLDEDLEHRGHNQRVEQADDSIIDVPETSNTNLHTQDDEDRDQGCHEGCSPNGYNFVAKRICEFRIDDLTIVEENWERARRCWVGFVDTESDGTHNNHGEDIEPCHFEPSAGQISAGGWMQKIDLPLTEAGTAVEVTTLFVESRSTGTLFTMMAVMVAVGRSSSWVDDSLITRSAIENPHFE